MGKKHIDPIPEQFSSYEEAAEFWDAHDTADYPENFRTVEVKGELRRRHYEVEIDLQVARELQIRAKKRGITPSQMASDLLRRQLAIAD